MSILESRTDRLPKGRMLMINPPYVHFNKGGKYFIKDETPILPLGPLYAGELIERMGLAEVEYYDCQLYDLWLKNDLEKYDSIGISTMGAQNIASVFQIYNYVSKFKNPNKIYIGGQGAEKLMPNEFDKIFPGAIQVSRESLLLSPNCMQINISKQIDKFPLDELNTYLSNEVTLLLSQGCMYGCSFCAAQNRQQENFYNTKDNLEYLLCKAKEFKINRTYIYCTSLDFFQQALPRHDLGVLKRILKEIIELQKRYGTKLKLRALTRADSYNAATESPEIWDLVKEAGFYKFGFGADGAASIDVLKTMRRGTSTLKIDIVKAFEHTQKHDLIPEMLYVFGIPEDTEETLRETRNFCVGLLKEFKNSQYRGFPAKNEIPGNRNWSNRNWKQSSSYQRLLNEPILFLNLGYETLVNNITHPDIIKRKLVNQYAVEMSYIAHKLGRVQSFLTIPIMDTDGYELMDDNSFEHLIEILKIYIPNISRSVSLKELPALRAEINSFIPKDR
jgi:radical SAM superfamily enzyme YgiQ (UPF0313 family)